MVYRTEHMEHMKPTRKASPQVSTAQLSVEPGTGFQSLISIFRDQVKDKAPQLGTGYGVHCLAIPCCLAFTFVNLCPNGVSIVAMDSYALSWAWGIGLIMIAVSRGCRCASCSYYFAWIALRTNICLSQVCSTRSLEPSSAWCPSDGKVKM